MVTRQRTISSLQIGHTSREEAAAAAAWSTFSRETLEPMSCVSRVGAGEFEFWELRDTELSDGDRRLTFLLWRDAGAGETAGDSDRPLPRIRPPPRDLREVILGGLLAEERSKKGDVKRTAFLAVLGGHSSRVQQGKYDRGEAGLLEGRGPIGGTR